MGQRECILCIVRPKCYGHFCFAQHGIVPVWGARRAWYAFSSRKREMASTFVAINDWCHSLLRGIARETPLVCHGVEGFSCELTPERLPESYFSLVACHTLDGLPLEQVRAGCWRIRQGCKRAVLQAAGALDALRLDRRCRQDLRIGAGGDVELSALLVGDLLSFGVGTLRRMNPHWADGRLHTELEQASARIWALGQAATGTNPAGAKQVFDSSNVIYGDAFGQLEQLWERRAEMSFLDQVSAELGVYRRWRELPPPVNAPLNWAAVAGIHVRSQARWHVPPQSGRALLRRVEWILENTILDSRATTLRSGKTSRISGEN